MTIAVPHAAASAAVSFSASSSLPSSTLPAAPAPARAPERAEAIFRAAGLILAFLESGRPVDAGALRGAMCEAFGGTDAQGFWRWKDAYEACEVAQALFLRKFGAAMRARAGDPAALLAMLEKVARLLPTHTKRSAESQALQQLSTPIPLAFAAAQAAGLTPADLVLEPSAGTGLLAIFAELAGAQLALNELAETRAALLGLAFPGRCGDAPRRGPYPRSSRCGDQAVRHPDEPAVFGGREGRGPASPTPPCGMSLPRSRALPKAAGWSPSPASVSRPRTRPGARPSSGFRRRAASSSPPPSTGASMHGTAPRSRRASP